MFYLGRLLFNSFIYLFFISNPPPLAPTGDLSFSVQTHHKKHNQLAFFSFIEPSVPDFSLFTVSLICLLYLVLVQSICCLFWSEECKFIFAVRLLFYFFFFLFFGLNIIAVEKPFPQLPWTFVCVGMYCMWSRQSAGSAGSLKKGQRHSCSHVHLSRPL